jgi:hypothetical protein
MDKLIHQFESVCSLAKYIFVGLIFLLKKICLETNFDAVNDREEVEKCIAFAENARKENAKPSC